MKQFCLGSLLLLGAAPVVAGPDTNVSPDAQILYLQQIDVAIQQGRLTQAQQMIASVEQSGANVFADELALLRAEYAIARNDLPSAGEALSGIRNPARNICRIQLATGWVAANARALDDAIIALADVTKNCPDDAAAWNLFGLAFIGKGETSAASVAFARAMILEPGNPQVINNHALAVLQKGNVSAALNELNAAVIQDPQDRMIRANRNFVAGLAGLSPQRAEGETDADWSAKLLQFARGAKTASRNIQATAMFSRAILTLEQFDEAIWSELNPADKGPR